MDNKDSDQTERIRRLILDFVGRTYGKVCVLMFRLILRIKVSDILSNLIRSLRKHAYSNI